MRLVAILALLGIAGCGGGVGTMPILEVELLADRTSLEVTTVCARDLAARVIEAETEIVITLAGERLRDDCASSVVVVLEAAAGIRFVRDGANGTVFGWTGTTYLPLPAP